MAANRSRRIAQAALGYVGVPFRLQGRSTTGLDCLGLVILSLREAGFVVRDRKDYGLRNHDLQSFEEEAVRIGLQPGAGSRPKEGDILVSRQGNGCIHLLVATSPGLVESNISRRKVVLRPVMPKEEWLMSWQAE